MSGKLVVICGIDGSGKTLQCELLSRRAREAGARVETISFPRYGEGFFGELIARYLRGEFGEDPGEVSPYLAALPFACDRWEVSAKIEKWLKKGELVVCNRYVSANLAYQGAKISSPEARNKFIEWAEKMEYEIFRVPPPELQVLLDVPPDIASELVSRKEQREYVQPNKSPGNGRRKTSLHSEGRAFNREKQIPLIKVRDIHEKELSYQEKTREVYLQLAARAGWVTIECAPDGRLLPPEEIAEKVWQHVSKLI